MAIAPPSVSRAKAPSGDAMTVRGFFGVFKYSRRAIELVWSTSQGLTLYLAALTIIAGVLPASVAFVGSRIVDSVVAAMRSGGMDASRVLEFVLLEGILIATIAAAQRGISFCQSLLRALVSLS